MPISASSRIAVASLMDDRHRCRRFMRRICPRRISRHIGLNSPTVGRRMEVRSGARAAKGRKARITAGITAARPDGQRRHDMLRAAAASASDSRGWTSPRWRARPAPSKAATRGHHARAGRARAGCEPIARVIARQMQRNWEREVFAFAAPGRRCYGAEVIGGPEPISRARRSASSTHQARFLSHRRPPRSAWPSRGGPALSAGVVDCGVTAALGQTPRWPE